MTVLTVILEFFGYWAVVLAAFAMLMVMIVMTELVIKSKKIKDIILLALGYFLIGNFIIWLLSR